MQAMSCSFKQLHRNLNSKSNKQIDMLGHKAYSTTNIVHVKTKIEYYL